MNREKISKIEIKSAEHKEKQIQNESQYEFRPGTLCLFVQQVELFGHVIAVLFLPLQIQNQRL